MRKSGPPQSPAIASLASFIAAEEHARVRSIVLDTDRATREEELLVYGGAVFGAATRRFKGMDTLTRANSRLNEQRSNSTAWTLIVAGISNTFRKESKALRV
jgi:hypothetical protein